MTRLGFVLDQRACIGCCACTVTCNQEHDIEHGVFRIWAKYMDARTARSTSTATLTRPPSATSAGTGSTRASSRPARWSARPTRSSRATWSGANEASLDPIAVGDSREYLAETSDRQRQELEALTGDAVADSGIAHPAPWAGACRATSSPRVWQPGP